MGRNLLLYLFLFGAFASVMANGLSGPSEGRGESEVRRADHLSETDEASGESVDSTNSWTESIERDRGLDGHFYADVEVNGQRLHFLVDTGASGIALTREDARRAGLATSISMPSVVGEGASGAVHGEVVMLDRVALGSKLAKDVPAVVLDSGSQSLLGQSFLSKFDSVEIRGDRMVLQ